MVTSTRPREQASSRVTSGGDIPSAKQVIRNAARSNDGITRLTTQTGTIHERAALALLAGSTDAVSAADLIAFAAIGATPDGTPTWSELVTAIGAS